MIKVVAQFHFNAGTAAQVNALAEELVRTTRKEDGCNQYDFLLAEKDENYAVILETWATQQALDAHSASEHFTRIVPQLAGLCVQPPSVETFTLLF